MLLLLRNQPRKRIDIAFKAFGLFSRGKDDVKYYHHGGIKDAGIDVVKMAHRCGITEKLILTSRNLSPQNYVSDEVLNKIYNIGDIGLNTCYAPGTKVLTTTGHVNIEDVSIGDTVFSHTGTESTVTNTFKHSNSNTLLEIKPYGIPKFVLTKEHELYADIRQYTHVQRRYKDDIRTNPNLQFIPVKFLSTGSVLTFPVIKEEKITISDELAFIYGAFIAEGCVHRDGITFSLNSGSPDDELRDKIITYMKTCFNLDAHINNMSRNRQNVVFYSRKLISNFEEKFGRGAGNKHLPNDFIFLNRSAKISLLYAYLLGDGHISHKEHRLSFTTISERLAWDVWKLLTSLGNIAPGISQRTRGEWVVDMHGESAKEFARIAKFYLRNPHKQQRDKMWADETYVYYPINKLSEVTPEEFIYDLEVAGEHSYVTHVAGHNSAGEGFGLCLGKDTEIITANGYKKIQNIKVGDEVYGKDGKLTRVTNLFSRNFNGNIQKIKVSGYCEEIFITKEHPVLVGDGFKKAGDLTTKDMLHRPHIQGKLQFSKVNLTHYGQFKHIDDYIYFDKSPKKFGIKIIKRELDPVRRLYNSYLKPRNISRINKYIPVDDNLATLLGSILVEYSVSQSKFMDLPGVLTALEDLFNYVERRDRGKFRVREDIKVAFNNMARTQEIYMAMPTKVLKNLLDQFIRNRGYVHPTNQRLILAATKLWKKRIIRLILDRLGIARSEFKMKFDGTTYFSLDKKYLYEFKTSKYTKNTQNRHEDISGFDYRILSVDSEPYSGTVYNFETENHTYTVAGYVVHNCNIEHTMTGHPQIVGNHSANRELYADGRGILVPINHYDTSLEIMTEGAMVTPVAVAEAMEYAYTHREEMKAMGKRAREYFLQDTYNWKYISRKFAEILQR